MELRAPLAVQPETLRLQRWTAQASCSSAVPAPRRPRSQLDRIQLDRSHTSTPPPTMPVHVASPGTMPPPRHHTVAVGGSRTGFLAARLKNLSLSRSSAPSTPAYEVAMPAAMPVPRRARSRSPLRGGQPPRMLSAASSPGTTAVAAEDYFLHRAIPHPHPSPLGRTLVESSVGSAESTPAHHTPRLVPSDIGATSWSPHIASDSASDVSFTTDVGPMDLGITFPSQYDGSSRGRHLRNASEASTEHGSVTMPHAQSSGAMYIARRQHQPSIYSVSSSGQSSYISKFLASITRRFTRGGVSARDDSDIYQDTQETAREMTRSAQSAGVDVSSARSFVSHHTTGSHSAISPFESIDGVVGYGAIPGDKSNGLRPRPIRCYSSSLPGSPTIGMEQRATLMTLGSKSIVPTTEQVNLPHSGSYSAVSEESYPHLPPPAEETDGEMWRRMGFNAASDDSSKNSPSDKKISEFILDPRLRIESCVVDIATKKDTISNKKYVVAPSSTTKVPSVGNEEVFYEQCGAWLREETVENGAVSDDRNQNLASSVGMPPPAKYGRLSKRRTINLDPEIEIQEEERMKELFERKIPQIARIHYLGQPTTNGKRVLFVPTDKKEIDDSNAVVDSTETLQWHEVVPDVTSSSPTRSNEAFDWYNDEDEYDDGEYDDAASERDAIASIDDAYNGDVGTPMSGRSRSIATTVQGTGNNWSKHSLPWEVPHGSRLGIPPNRSEDLLSSRAEMSRLSNSTPASMSLGFIQIDNLQDKVLDYRQKPRYPHISNPTLADTTRDSNSSYFSIRNGILNASSSTEDIRSSTATVLNPGPSIYNLDSQRESKVADNQEEPDDIEKILTLGVPLAMRERSIPNDTASQNGHRLRVQAQSLQSRRAEDLMLQLSGLVDSSPLPKKILRPPTWTNNSANSTPTLGMRNPNKKDLFDLSSDNLLLEHRHGVFKLFHRKLSPQRGRTFSNNSRNSVKRPLKRSGHRSVPHPIIITSHIRTAEDSELLTSPSGEEEISVGRLNQYFLMRDIGYGAYGRVSLCRNENDGRYYACKMISKSRLKRKFRWKLDQDGLTMIKREIEILKRVSAHVNINSLIEVLDDEDEDMIYMIFELCEYGPIMNLKLDGLAPAYSEDIARDYFRDIICGIGYMHKQHIVHRDIKPENLLIKACLTSPSGDFIFDELGIAPIQSVVSDGKSTSRRFMPKKKESIEDKLEKYYLSRRGKGYIQIADFGISELFTGPPLKSRKGRKPNGKNVPEPAFKTNMGVNTSPLFMAPEHCLGEKSVHDLDGYKMDIWALGITLYALVHGRVPFKSTDILPLMDEIIESTPVIDSNLSSELKTLLQRMLDKNPDTRISIKEISQSEWVTQGWWQMPEFFGIEECKTEVSN